ncbi:TLD-domain-containing protein [Melanogaster broomeanus]|nr:TLD-domain-containing protein [Melanogaster broomeanus]
MSRFLWPLDCTCFARANCDAAHLSLCALEELITSSSSDHLPQPSFPPPTVPEQNSQLDESAIDRFAVLFSPATPPATPTHSEFGAFVSVPPSQDPLSLDFDGDATTSLAPAPQSTIPSLTSVFSKPTHLGNSSLEYFDQFTANAKTAAERNRRDVLDELLEHQDDPLYFLNALAESRTPPSTAPPLSNTNKVVRPESRNSLKGAPTSKSTSRVPLPPRLSGAASPPSVSSPTGSTTSLPLSSSPLPAQPQLSSSPPAHGTLSRLSSSLVSLLPTSRAPGFGGDRTWDHGFSETLLPDEELDVVAPTATAPALATEWKAKGRPAKGKGVTLLGRREGTVGVLNEEIADLLRPHLPALTRLPRNWTLLYSLDQHGISLNTLYSRCEPRIPSRANPNPPQGGLVAIRDARDAVFGAWLSEGVRLERGYYGSGESFLWRYHPPQGAESSGRLDVYKWTGRNDYVALCQPEFISFGGGDGHYGLYLDASLLDGSSAPCPTFGNPALSIPSDGSHARAEATGAARAKPDVSFECVALEVWGIGPG